MGRPPKQLPGEDTDDTSAVSKPLFEIDKAPKMPVKINTEFEVVFYCDGTFSFSLPKHETDADGSVVLENGKPKIMKETDIDGNNPHTVYESYKFTPIPILDPATGRQDPKHIAGQFIVRPEDPRRDDLIKRLIALTAHGLNHIYTEDQWKHKINPQAFEVDKRLRATIAEKNQLADRNAALEARLAELGVTV